MGSRGEMGGGDEKIGGGECLGGGDGRRRIVFRWRRWRGWLVEEEMRGGGGENIGGECLGGECLGGGDGYLRRSKEEVRR